MRDQFDVDLEDSDLLGEVELCISLMIAGTEAPGHLSREQVDALLGVTPVAPDSGLVPRQAIRSAGVRHDSGDASTLAG